MLYLESLNSLDSTTKANRFRFITAILNWFYDNGWIESKDRFWKDIKIKVNKKVQQAAEEKELEILLSLIDTSTFIGWRGVLEFENCIYFYVIASLLDNKIFCGKIIIFVMCLSEK